VTQPAYPLSKLAELLECSAHGDDVTITGVGTIDEAKVGQITFIEKADMLPAGERSGASALIVPPTATTARKPIIVTEDPRLAFNRVLQIFAPEPKCYAGVHPTAVIEDGVIMGENISVGAYAFIGQNTILGDNVRILPSAYIGHEVTIGSGTTVHPQVYIGERVIVGDNCIIHAGATIGADGFGFAPTPDGHHKIPQIGTVIIEDDVEIGANTTVDRATVNVTRIGAGTKIDDSVHIAHNVSIGKHCLLCGEVGIAGSATIGDRVTMGGQVGVSDHVKVCDDVVLGGKCGVISDIDEPGVYSGFPAVKHGTAMRAEASLRKLPALLKQFKALQARISELEQRLADNDE